ncbi:hypothetical protein BSKO_10338 [Bryopsis sp. KO-2023]|nr:hypothetical protein BSKO_10338 [Bryopsis sp. KO-2023]
MFDFSGIDDGVVGTSVGGLAETKPRRKERLPLAGVQPDGNKTRAVDKIRSLFDMRELDELKQRKQQENDGKSMKAKIDEEDPTFSTAKLTNVSSGLVGSRKEEESKRNGATKKPVSSLGFVGSSEGEKSKRDGATKKPALLKLYVEPCSEGALCEKVEGDALGRQSGQGAVVGDGYLSEFKILIL